MNVVTPLRAYQYRAVANALPHDGYALFPEQRSGKTLMSLTIAARKKPDRLLIVTVKKGIRVWREEMKKHLTEPFPDTQIINYEQLLNRRTKEKLKRWLQKGTRSMMIADEAHKIKRRGSKQSRAVRLLGKRCKYRLALTGTPIAQGRWDAWAIFDFIDPSIFGKFQAFQKRYLIMGGFKGKKIVGFRKKKEFDRIFHEHSFRVTLREIRDKPLIVQRKKIKFKLDPITRKAYRSMERGLEIVVNRKKIKAPLVVNIATKLQQLCGGWIIPPKKEGQRHRPDPVRVGPGEKMMHLKHLLHIHRLRKQPVVICAKYTHEIEEIGWYLNYVGSSYKTIEGGVEFDGKFDTDVVLIQVQAGIAIDLSGARVLIFYSWDYSHIHHDQMLSRVLTFDVPKVVYYYLIAKGTVDEDFYEAVTRKKRLADIVCDRYRWRNRRGG